MSITINEYVTLDEAYNFFNGCLFHDQLPQCLITYQRGKKYKGYFSPNRFVTLDDGRNIPEIALNPEHFGEGDHAVLSTLVHEMCHVWQEFHGKRPRAGYHDRQWAGKMLEVGLIPFNVKDPSSHTGASCSHVIDLKGVFKSCCDLFLVDGKRLQHMARTDPIKEKKKKNSSKTKFTCPNCGINCWGKPDLRVICSDCYELEEGQIFTLLPEAQDSASE